MDDILNKKIGELSQENYEYIKLFQKYNLDFFCKGTLTLEEAIDNANANKGELLKEFSQINNKSGYIVKLEEWPLDLLADYIQKTHHRFTDNILVKLKEAVKSFLEKDLQEKEIISALENPLGEMSGELGAHMKREELILFPAVKRLVMARGKIEEPGEKTVKNPVDKMIHEHDTQYILLQEIRSVLKHYSTEETSSDEYVYIVNLMKELDTDLELHLHLENNILFPKAVELERQKVNVG